MVIVLSVLLTGIILAYAYMAKRSVQSRPTELPSEEYDENPADAVSPPETTSYSNSIAEQNPAKRKAYCENTSVAESPPETARHSISEQK